LKFLLVLITILFAQLSYAQELKILSWNIFMIPKPINWTFQKERAEIIVDTLKDSSYEVLFFQEAFAVSARKRLIAGLKNTYPFMVTTNGKKFGTVQNSGLLVFSKYPARKISEVVFLNCTKSDCLARKSALLVEIDHPAGPKLQFINTHLQAWNTPKAIEVRRQQLQDIRQLLSQHKTSNVPQFVIGDLNVDGLNPSEFGSSLALLSMEATRLTGEIQTTNGFKIGCYKIPGSEEQGEWLDHLWFDPKEAIKPRSSHVMPFMGEIKGMTCPLSDHYAVESIISLAQ
jgi:endonuclease/exonuclease/phosphatase family metal-dependent hydrolase